MRFINHKTIFGLLLLGSTLAFASDTYPIDTGTTAWTLSSSAHRDTDRRRIRRINLDDFGSRIP